MLRISRIAFPGIGIPEFSVESVAFRIGSVEIAWYAILITIGIICAVVYAMYRSGQIGIRSDDVLDIVLWAVPLGVVGARLYYILTKIEYFPTFKDWINIRGGGLAIYGGLIGGALAVIGVCHFKKINFFAFADCAFPGIILAQAIGRWGNFMNGEAFGYVTDWFCRMELTNVLTDGIMMAVHPTFFYESLWNVIGFVLINLIYKKKKYDGQFSLMVCGWYGFGRFFIEGLRTDSLYTTIFGITFRTSQILGGAIFLVCAALQVYFAIRPTGRSLYHYEGKKG